MCTHRAMFYRRASRADKIATLGERFSPSCVAMESTAKNALAERSDRKFAAKDTRRRRLLVGLTRTTTRRSRRLRVTVNQADSVDVEKIEGTKRRNETRSCGCAAVQSNGVQYMNTAERGARRANGSVGSLWCL